jgi:hypothetical protein
MDDPKKRIRFCAPGVKIGDVPTCYTKAQLIVLAKIMKLSQSGNKSQLWHSIRNYMSDKCRYESCWMEKTNINSDEKSKMKKQFLPKRPQEWNSDIHTWLSNYDINAIMKLFEKQYPDFSYLGTVTSDCPIAYKCELSEFNMNKLFQNGITQAGIIYNLDTHTQSGSHWVALFIDLKRKPEISYFDSYGFPPPSLIKKFILVQQSSINSELHKGLFGGGHCKKQIKYIYNTKRHQRGHSECGVFSINYILEKLKGKKMSQISRVRISDEDMNILRRNLFRH